MGEQKYNDKKDLRRNAQGDQQEEAVTKGTTPERVRKTAPQADTVLAPASDKGYPRGLEDAYHETEGQEYDREEPPREQLESGAVEQSGVQSPLNRPGTRAVNPRHKERME